MVGAPDLKFGSGSRGLQKSAGESAPIESVGVFIASPVPTKRCRCADVCLRPNGPLKECGHHLRPRVARSHERAHMLAQRRPSIALPIPGRVDAANFWSKIDQANEGECWNWRAGKTKFGYGRFRIGDRLYSAHRIAYVLANGHLPVGIGYHGFVVMHACDNPACCNPAHLSIGTNRDNARDMGAKGRNNIATGVRRTSPSRLSLEAGR